MDIALAVEQLLPAADYRRADSYAALVDTWKDERPVPTEAALEAAWAAYEEPLPATVPNLAFTEALIERGVFPDAVEALLDGIVDLQERWIAKVRWQQSPIALEDSLLRAQAEIFWPAEEEPLEILREVFVRAVEIATEQGLE